MEARSQGIGTRHPLGMVYLCLYLLSISWSISFLFLLCISNQLCMHTNLAFSILGSAQVLCILSQSVHLYVQLPCCILENCFLDVKLHLWFLSLSTPSSVVPGALMGRVWYVFSTLGWAQSFILWTLTRWDWLSVLIAIYYKKKLPWWTLRDALIYVSIAISH